MTAKIKERGVLVNTTIKVTANDKTGNKIKIDKKYTAMVFSQIQYDGSKDAMNYYVYVPYTKTMPCYITEITSKDNLLDGQMILFSVDEDSDPADPDVDPYIISVKVKKDDLEKEVEAGKVKLGKQYTVKATVKFGKQVQSAETQEWSWQTDNTIKPEEISLKLTLPEAVSSTDYTGTVAAVKAAKDSIINKVSEGLEFQKDWVDEDGNLTYEGTEAMSWFLEGALDNLMAEVRALAPEDSGTSVSTDLVIDGMDYTDTDVFKAPTSQTDGYFKVVLRMAKTEEYDYEQPKAGTFEDITFELKIAKTMEEPNDLKVKLDEFVATMGTNEAYKKAQDEDAVRKAILADAKAYVQIEKYDTLRMDVEDFYFQSATDQEQGYIYGVFHVWGIRYGGKKLTKDFSITFDKLDDIDET